MHRPFQNLGYNSTTTTARRHGRNQVSHHARQAVLQGFPPRSRRQGSPSAFQPFRDSEAILAGKNVVWQPIGRPSKPGGASKLNGLRKSRQLSRISDRKSTRLNSSH